jgi:uroporphyrinogen-III synthase
VADLATSPLFGKTVFVSRSAEKNNDLVKELESRGANAISVPLISFGPPEDLGPIDDALNNLSSFDWIIFTSQVAVEFTARRASALGISIAQSGISVAVVGPTTADLAKEAGLQVDYVALKSQGAAFVEELSTELKGKRILFPRSNLAPKSLVDQLARSGSSVTAVVAYQTLPRSQDEQRDLNAIRWGVMDAALFFSPSAVHHFVDWIGIQKVKEHHQHIVFVAAGPTTAETLRKTLGFIEIVEALQPTVPGVLASLENFFHERSKIPSVSVNPQ